MVRKETERIEQGTSLGKEQIIKIWNWTQNDCEALFKGFYVFKTEGSGGCGPSSGFAIYLVTLMDIWGSIMKEQFGVLAPRENVGKILSLLKKEFGKDLYQYAGSTQNNLTDILRHNLIHNYGLKVLHNGDIRYWLTIDVNSNGPVINKVENERWHIDCLRLRNHILKIIEDWLKEKKYI